MDRRFSLGSLKTGKAGLKKGTVTVEKSGISIENDIKRKAEAEKIREVTGIQNDNDRIKYFFDAGVDSWYETLKESTFASSFISFKSRDEIDALMSQNFRDESVRKILSDLEQRLDRFIQEEHNGLAFVKLSSRSPKDSKIILDKAAEEFHKATKSAQYTAMNGNDKWAAFSNEVRKACMVRSGEEALALLLNSERVFEDLKYASEYDGEESVLDLIKVVVRSFDDRINTRNEFRGFVWNGKFVCVGQYFSKIYFPELNHLKERVASDFIKFFENKVAKSIQVPCFMMDLVWLDSGEVILVEINPFDGEELGAFPASTGLFDWDKDRDLMTGKRPFEIRVLESPVPNHIRTNGSGWTPYIYPK
mmetsp:Transcript_9583/g.12433  ORF Transcript_9583/g.12433 Transcript_9583/m.12433 type:complete len:363 (-) Transcript_9583:50-1138(-)